MGRKYPTDRYREENGTGRASELVPRVEQSSAMESYECQRSIALLFISIERDPKNWQRNAQLDQHGPLAKKAPNGRLRSDVLRMRRCQRTSIDSITLCYARGKEWCEYALTVYAFPPASITHFATESRTPCAQNIAQGVPCAVPSPSPHPLPPSSTTARGLRDSAHRVRRLLRVTE